MPNTYTESLAAGDVILCSVIYDQQVAAVPRGSHWRALKIIQVITLILYSLLGLCKIQRI